ncbi:MAG: chromate efflux transporter [Myxococcota bacterium]
MGLTAAGAGSEVATVSSAAPLRELVRLFLRLGATAFGGPAAHIAMMEDEVVERRRWLSKEEFLDLVGATNLIPGPNSTEMAIHIGHRVAGWPGLFVAGICFIVPAVALTLLVAWAYVEYGALPEGRAVLYGIKPVMVVVVLQAIWRLGRAALKGPLAWGVAAVALGAAFFEVNELVVLFGAGLLLLAIRGVPRRKGALLVAWPLALPVVALGGVPVTSERLFWVFLKIGSVLFGSGYVLLAFLRADLVERLGWLRPEQLLDAIAAGQVTPGPVFSTATFIGYVLAGPAGAAAATLGIFLPAFLFVALSGPLVPRLRQSWWAGALLDGVNIGAWALMAAVTVRLAKEAVVDLPSVLFALVAAVALLRFRLNSTWLVAGGALAGLVGSYL